LDQVVEAVAGFQAAAAIFGTTSAKGLPGTPGARPQEQVERGENPASRQVPG
jgi:hypothetical protein